MPRWLARRDLRMRNPFLQRLSHPEIRGELGANPGIAFRRPHAPSPSAGTQAARTVEAGEEDFQAAGFRLAPAEWAAGTGARAAVGPGGAAGGD